MATDEAESGSHQRRFLNVMVVIAAIAFVTFSVFLIRMIKRGVEPQNCRMAGFNDCEEVNAPLITVPHR